ncbi:MAG: hypothetical protein GF334_01870 [Candidatus Altiarchaeales archaeon]|nr:hypothetical protein [Candidatus Altiarchaeales archaeon]
MKGIAEGNTFTTAIPLVVVLVFCTLKSPESGTKPIDIGVKSIRGVTLSIVPKIIGKSLVVISKPLEPEITTIPLVVGGD